MASDLARLASLTRSPGTADASLHRRSVSRNMTAPSADSSCFFRARMSLPSSFEVRRSWMMPDITACCLALSGAEPGGMQVRSSQVRMPAACSSVPISLTRSSNPRYSALTIISPA